MLASNEGGWLGLVLDYFFADWGWFLVVWCGFGVDLVQFGSVLHLFGCLWVGFRWCLLGVVCFVVLACVI